MKPDSENSPEYYQYNTILKPLLKEDLIVGKKYSSPIKGRSDSDPSFSVYRRGDNLFWKDFGHNGSGPRIEHLVMDIYGCGTTEAKKLLSSTEILVSDPKFKPAKEFHAVWDKLDYTELLWWKQFHVTPRTLNKFKVKGARRMYDNHKLTYDYRHDPMAFYYVGERKELWQFYQPKSRLKKRFQRNGSFLLGWEQLPLTGKNLYIVSGMKDGLPLYELGASFLSGAGETDTANFRKVLPELRLRFTTIRTLLDPDKPGRDATDLLFTKLGIPPADFQYPNKTDDIADLVKKRGINYLKDVLHIT